MIPVNLAQSSEGYVCLSRFILEFVHDVKIGLKHGIGVGPEVSCFAWGGVHLYKLGVVAFESVLDVLNHRWEDNLHHLVVFGLAVGQTLQPLEP